MLPRAVLPFVLLLACTSSARGQSAPNPEPPLADLRLAPGDAVRLGIRDEPTLSGEFPVAETGQVLLPEIGLVQAGGRAFGDVDQEIRRAYGRLLVNEQLVIVPVIRVAVLGEVRKPGLFPVDGSQTVADVLASAGGLTELGNPRAIVLRHPSGSTRVHLDPGERALEAHLHSGDQIVVGRYGWMRQNLPVLVGAGVSVLGAAVTSFIVRH